MNNFFSFFKYSPLLIVFFISSGLNARTLSFSGPKDYAHLIENLSSSELAKVKAGFSLFAKPWVGAPSSTRVRDGLGPHFNATSCMSCHSRMGRGNPFKDQGSLTHSILFRVSTGNTATTGPVPHNQYGLQLQGNSLHSIPREAEVSVKFEHLIGFFSDGEKYELRKPHFTVNNLNYGPLGNSTLLSPRTSPHLAGLGYIDSIPVEDILSNSDENDIDGDGISGRANFSWSSSEDKLLLGRFGHKANVPKLIDQIAGAFQGDMGITSSLSPRQNCAYLQSECHSVLSGGDPEISDNHLEFIHLLLKSIKPPKVEVLKPHLLGKKIFTKIGCTKCHIPKFKSLDTNIYPYSDFLLHDMGKGLADNRADFKASGNEWKTTPLWGLGSLRKVNGHMNLLHDGRARNISEAILWHGGEGRSSKEKFVSLTKDERDSLIKFLQEI